ncbi:type VII secretion system-associated protein [Nocardia amamiensis]|uniref:type VII secretion system-associated protein n=1 Tax=Nocardia amamiensis TaxID=404578 RepID=UPI000A59BEA4|nr:type VII secretion system-associated protein [Nocardia amamiensis]
MNQPDPQTRWLVLTAPGWEPSGAAQQPPLEAIVGGWRIGDDGRSGPFEPNLAYSPADESMPSDPLDAILRQVAADASPSGDQRQLISDFIATLRRSIVDIGCDVAGWPVIGTTEGVPCVLIATAAVHRQGVDADRWHPVVGDKLADVVPAGVDILINPDSHASCRLTVDALRQTPPRA